MTTEELQPLIIFLERAPAIAARLTEDVPAHGLIWKPSATAFSVLDHICHLRDIEQEGYTARIRKLLTEEQPFLPDIDGDRLAIERQYNAQRLEPALTEFQRLRQANVRVLKDLSPGQLSRSGLFENTGPITLAHLLRLMHEHDTGHLEALSDLREQLVR
jgi:hypothetical protein